MYLWWILYYIYIYYIYIYIWVQVKIQGPEQGPGPHPFHTPVPYLRSIPVWRIRSIPLFHTSVPYLWSISYYLFMYVRTCAIWFHMCMQIHEHTIHTWVHTRKTTFTMPKPCDWIGKPVLRLQLLPTLLMRLAAVGWQSKNGLLWPSLSTCGRFAPVPLIVASRCGTAVLYDGRDALSCCQLAV